MESFFVEKYKNNCTLIPKHDIGGVLTPNIQQQLDELKKQQSQILTTLKQPQIPIITNNNTEIGNSDNQLTFGNAFKSARKQGLSTFKWNGNLYTTQVKDDGKDFSKDKKTNQSNQQEKKYSDIQSNKYYTTQEVNITAPRKRITTIEQARNFLWGEQNHNYNNYLDFPIIQKGYYDTNINNLADNQSFTQKGNSLLYKTDKKNIMSNDDQIKYLQRREQFYDIWRKRYPQKQELSLSFFQKKSTLIK